ncbi:hypothetical protein TraAM80_07157 [Trypanosoma rangeli]|uniref:Uncharacterized protein n=1 Tax=Trypanosoma rangeli TaxID=5698 RepID=A0A422N6T1_TRYRA|nr:uncharacterized protein TraAM80_07157 [Trypanosoma rangeli]RNF01188.1 hypothetical protein TraAM80_07157 [Trypanosoma rangeli]|eukprot:RNF01188.1 hypothetical protein TraAM80_07157 [Trypanosoma rangeli]
MRKRTQPAVVRAGCTHTCASLHPDNCTLKVKLGAAPVTALLVPLDAVARAKANPVRHRPVLVQLLRILLLDCEWLETTHGVMLSFASPELCLPGPFPPFCCCFCV